MKRPALALLVVVSLVAAACNSPAASAPAGSPGSAPSTAARTAVPSAASAGQSAVTGGDGRALCAFLTTELPLLQNAGSTGGAVAELAIDYANWIAADSSRGLPDAGVMDTLTQASCPDVRTKVLKLIGSDSFATGL